MNVAAMPTRRLWMIHLVSLASVGVWAMLDLRFEAMMGSVVGAFSTSLGESLPIVIEQTGTVRIVVLGVVVFSAVSTLGLLLVRVFRSDFRSRSRSVLALLSMVTVSALWCGVVINHSAFAWQGNRFRMVMKVPTLETIAAPLRRDWPREDGNLSGVGPFMAYPFGRPSTLVLLESPSVSGGGLYIAAVERQSDGAILLQLSGTSHDDWAQWHPPSSRPESFVGGLSDPHELESWTYVGQGWYLVRYRSPDVRDVVRI